MYVQSLIPPTMSVSRTIRLFPATVAIFASFGIDAAAAGQVTVDEAARLAGADPIRLIGALNRVAEDAS